MYLRKSYKLSQRCVRNSLKLIETIQKCSYSSSTNVVETEISFEQGRSIHISTGKFARFANGSAIVRTGDTSVMVTAVSKEKPGTQSFTPLTVDYRQKSAAAGRIPTNFLRRELGPSEKEILSARLVDRSIRPLFPENFRCDTQIVCNMLAIDSVHYPDVQAINGASAALALSDIPWNGPVGAVRIGMCDNDFVINPTRRELQQSNLDLVVTATKKNLVVMLEGKGNVVLLQDLQHAIKLGTQRAQLIVNEIEKLQKKHGKAKRVFDEPPKLDEQIQEAVRTLCQMRLREVFSNTEHDKISRDQSVNAIRTDVVDRVWSTYPDAEVALIQDYFGKYCKEIFREMIFENDRRCDGRTLDDLRKIECQVDLHKPLHGSALFQRGQTQVFCTVSLDSLESALKLDTLTALDTGVKKKNFFLHYEFPPYATGEIGRIGPVGRRELGHGSLAERGLFPIIPNDFPFTIRLTSEVLESNGSSSMASVCAGSMALMDAGVPISSAAAGVAIGLVTKCENNDTKNLEDYRILTDLLGIEDYLGDMDMKVAGTRKGITALQADIKLPGVPLKVMMESLIKATDAKSRVLDIMDKCIFEPRKNKKENSPVTTKFKVEAHQRSKLIGPNGINIKKLYLEIGVQLTQLDDTEYLLFAPSQAAMEEAKEIIQKWMEEEKIPNLEFGAIYTAKIVELRDTGAMVTLYPNMVPALVHNSQLDQRKIVHPSAIGLEVGQEIQVKFFGRDPVSGHMRLSRKVLQGPASQVIRNFDRSKVSDENNLKTDTAASDKSEIS